MARPALADDPTPSVVDSTRGGGLSIGLTFDDGPNPPDTLRLLDVLREHHVKAVFCLWGDHVRQHLEVVRRIAVDAVIPALRSEGWRLSLPARRG
ncbi:polysaccharide deacetylase family protein [Microbispora camponoti]|uniref:Polysaccharide deacetylase family protein n=2 Tax=Microbispora bryophytorum TaxID=1460882 RepID=A0ABR8L6Y4_9ACTN|nr:polysaccharide deacetylase family protein [Microbispora camponoti]